MSVSLVLAAMLVAGQGAPGPLERGDSAFVGRNYAGAITWYESALASGKDSAGVLWRLSRVYICSAEVAPEDMRPDLYHRAEEFAVRSIRADPGRSEGHTWLASALCNRAVSGDAATKVKLCRSITSELDEAVRLDSCNDVAHSILGSFYKALGDLSWIQRQLGNLLLGGLPDGGYAEAERELRTAIGIAPWIIRHHLELGSVYLQQGRRHDALQEYRAVLSLPVLLQSDAPGQIEAWEIIRELARE